MVAFDVYRSERKRKYWRIGMSCLSWLENVVKKGSANGLGMLLLLKAMQLCSKRNAQSAKIREAFEAAIVSITRAGFKSLGAMANEKAGEAMDRLGDSYWAGYYFRRAHELYVEWGASIKAQQMLAKHDVLLHEGSSVFGNTKGGGNMLGRQRFDQVKVEPKQLDLNG